MPPKILVIDDDPSAARLVGYILEREGYHVDTVANGLEGIKMVRDEEPDLVILDVMLPGLDGFEVCYRLRAEPRTAQLPILMLSAKVQEIDKATGLRAGANEYLTKPADPEEVLTRVKALLGDKIAARSKVQEVVQEVGKATELTTGSALSVGFVGSSGGVGTTTVAVNTAIAMAQSNSSVLLVDLAPDSYSIPELLGLKEEHNEEHNLGALVGVSRGTLDSLQVEKALIAHPTGVRTLCSYRSINGSKELPPFGMVSLFEVLRTMGDYLLLDMSAHFSEVNTTVLGQCDIIVLVTGSGQDGLTTTRVTDALLYEAGIGRDRIVAVVVDRDGALSQQHLSHVTPKLELAIGFPLLTIVPQDVRPLLETKSPCTPMVLAEPQAPAAVALEKVADWILSHRQGNQIGIDQDYLVS